MNKQGSVEQQSTKPTASGGTAYNLKIDGEWFGCGFKDPGAGVGDVVTFTAVQNGKYMNASNVAVVQKATSAPVTTNAGGGSGSNWDTRDTSIKIQSCRKDAIAMMTIMLDNGAINIPEKAKAGDKYDTILNLIDELTARNYMVLEEGIANGGLSADDAIPDPSA